MKNILFVSNVNLKDPMRGTPLRTRNFLEQIQKEHQLFIPSFPQDNSFKKIYYLTRFIKQNNIDIVFASTTQSVKLVLALKLFTNVKIAVDIHGLIAEELYLNNSISNWRRFLLDKKIKFFLTFFDLIFTVSNRLKGYYQKTNANIQTIYGGVNSNEFFPLPKAVPSNSIFTIGYTGNSRSYQGLDYLIEAAYQIKTAQTFPFRLHLIVSDQVNNVMKKLEDKKLTNVTALQSQVPHQEINKIISQWDVLVIPRPKIAVTEYAYPSKLSEYLATGVPIVTTNVGPISELFEGNDYCYTIEAENISKNLTVALQTIYSLNDQTKNQLRQNTVNFVKQNLSWEVLGKRINYYLDQL